MQNNLQPTDKYIIIAKNIAIVSILSEVNANENTINVSLINDLDPSVLVSDTKSQQNWTFMLSEHSEIIFVFIKHASI